MQGAGLRLLAQELDIGDGFADGEPVPDLLLSELPQHDGGDTRLPPHARPATPCLFPPSARPRPQHVTQAQAQAPPVPPGIPALFPGPWSLPAQT